ncbi:MAG: hypothetical protein JSW73_05100 [Candidatus Woesearchaeota archaeon]|nr:MAG: hypothetical protein JSW73_05100 [Candidatus Woesearchaeota archaeon]
MAIKTTAYLSLREGLLYNLENPDDEYSTPFSDNDAKDLRSIINSIDDLQGGSRKVSDIDRIALGPNCIVPKDIKITENTPAPEITKHLYEGISSILQKYWVNASFYIDLGKSFEELNLKPSNDTKEIIEWANESFHAYKQLTGSDHLKMCWQRIKDGLEREDLGLPDSE